MANNEDLGFNTVNNSSLSRRDQRLKLQRMTLMAIGALMVLMVVTLAVLIIGYFVSSGSNPDDPNTPSGEVSKDKVIWATTPVSAQDTVTGENVYLNCVITDKDVVIRDGRVLSGHETKPFFIEKGSCV